jgi:hypothetical protein
MYANEAIKISRVRGSNYGLLTRKETSKENLQEKARETRAAPAIHAF